MWELIKDLLLVSLGMGIGVILMCIMSVGKEADRQMIELKESEENKWISDKIYVRLVP